ncbi:MAG: TlpA disulfide reductase family protein [Bacteroidota bacterium]
MKHSIAIIFLALLLSLEISSQDIKLIDSDGIASLSGRLTDTTYVINFWATWCSPCIKEIEFFEELHLNRQDHKLKVVLVSLDFPKQMESRLLPFLDKKDITAPVMLMTDLDYNAWIERVDKNWSGAIPATLIYNKDRRVFLEQELTREELLENVNQIMN